jgi:hypothetical protein
MAAAATAMVAVFAAIPAVLARGLAAGLTVTRTALVAMEMAAAAAAAVAAMMLVLMAEFPLAAGIGFGLRRFGGRTAEKSFQPAEKAAGFLWRLGPGCGREFGPTSLIAGGSIWLTPSRTWLGAGLGGPVVPALTLGTKDRPFAAAILAARARRRDVRRTDLPAAGLAGHGVE